MSPTVVGLWEGMTEHNVPGVCGEQRVQCVIFLYQHKVSRCESAADLVHFSPTAIKATMLQHSTRHPIVPSKKVFELRASLRPLAFGHLCLRESSAVSALWPSCITQRPHTRLQNNIICPHPDSSGLRIYYPQTAWRPWWQNSPLIAQCQIKVHTAHGALQRFPIGIMSHATWYCLIECAKTKLDSH